MQKNRGEATSDGNRSLSPIALLKDTSRFATKRYCYRVILSVLYLVPIQYAV
jgi:hypothetical protein